MALIDTSARASAVYFARLAQMSPEERVGVGMALWDAGDSLQRAAARKFHPEADDVEINFQIAVARYGQDLARKAYGKE